MQRTVVKLCGFMIDTFDFESAIEYAKTAKGQVVTINPEMIENGLKNPDFAKILNEANLVIPDGVGVKIGLKLRGANAQRIAGIEFSRRLIEECKDSVALIGAKPHVIQKAAENLKSEIPDLNIVYIQDGYFTDTERVYSELKSHSPKLILVALGSPKQEEFIYNLKSDMPDAIMVGVGGSFDVWAGEVQRAPVIYQKMGLEWLYRTVKQPERFKRIFPTLPKFLVNVILNK